MTAAIERRCQTCHQLNALSNYWTTHSSTGITLYALHCIACHDAGRVVHGYGPNNRWKSPQELDEHIARSGKSAVSEAPDCEPQFKKDNDHEGS
jgi:mono/diheme cytochrome c family protein